MSRSEQKKTFDCLALKWKGQAEIYQEIKDKSPDQQIEYFRRHAETGPFAELVRKLRGHVNAIRHE